MSCCAREEEFSGIIDSLKKIFSPDQLEMLNEACKEGKMQATIIPASFMAPYGYDYDSESEDEYVKRNKLE